MKKLVSIALALIIALSIAACGGGNTPSSDNSSNALPIQDSTEPAVSSPSPNRTVEQESETK